MIKSFAVFAVMSVACVAQAHSGFRIFLDSSGGRVTTLLGNNNESSTIFTPTRLFTTDLPNADGAGTYTTEFPGFQVATGSSVATGTAFSFNIAGPLFYFDDYNPAGGAGVFRSTADAFAGGAVPQMAVSETSSFVITASGPVAGFEIFPYNAPGDHGHLAYTLLGSGVLPASNGPSGVYALPLEVTGTGLATSETFYLLFGKDVAQTSAEMTAAMVAANAQFIPEPVSLGPVLLAGTLLVRRRR
jgi:hypothetical protein